MLRSYNSIFWPWIQPIYGSKFRGFSSRKELSTDWRTESTDPTLFRPHLANETD
jgi:hypothetical protein